MEFNVAQLLKESVGTSRQYEVQETFPPLGDIGVEKVQGRIYLVRTDLGIWVRGVLGASVPAVCSRCLDGFTQALKLRLDEQYYPIVDIHTGASLPTPDLEEGAFTLDAHHVLHLGEVVRQGAVTAFPLKPLCHSDCRGICSQCGTNLNGNTCQCREEQVDPRWAPLLAVRPTDRANS